MGQQAKEYYVIRRAYYGDGERRRAYHSLSEAAAVYDRLIKWINGTSAGRPSRGIVLLEHVALNEAETIEGKEMGRELVSAAALRPREY